MTIYRRSAFASAAALAVLIPLATASARAVSAPPTLNTGAPAFEQSQPQPMGWEEARRHKLRYAYWVLEQGDRDYRGHRAKAMEHVRKAGDIIGMDMHGEGYGGKHQAWSDERLREARGILRDLAEETHGREFDQIRAAVKEIDKALEVR